MHGKRSCNCNDAHREGEDDRGGEAAASCRCLSSHTAATLWSKKEKAEDQTLGYVFKIKPCRCRSWFCNKRACLKASAQLLLRRLLPVLETFGGMLMLTLTIDPKQFASPLDAFEYLKAKRCVTELMRSLSAAGYLRSHRYFYVVEWQRETQMPHFHILVDADFIPFDQLANAWNRFRPKSTDDAVGEKPDFWHVHISKRKITSPLHAAFYACAYLMKPPIDGYPDWVMSYRGQIKRFSTSRKLLTGSAPSRRKKVQRQDHPRDCVCEQCQQKRQKRSTVADRTLRCSRSTMLVRVPELEGPEGEIVHGRPQFVARAMMHFGEVSELLTDYGWTPSDAITLQNWEELLRLFIDHEGNHEQANASRGSDIDPRALPDSDAAKTSGAGLPSVSESAA